MFSIACMSCSSSQKAEDTEVQQQHSISSMTASISTASTPSSSAQPHQSPSSCIVPEEESTIPYASLPADLLDPADGCQAEGVDPPAAAVGTSLPDLAETLKAAFSTSRRTKDGVFGLNSSGMYNNITSDPIILVVYCINVSLSLSVCMEQKD